MILKFEKMDLPPNKKKLAIFLLHDPNYNPELNIDIVSELNYKNNNSRKDLLFTSLTADPLSWMISGKLGKNEESGKVWKNKTVITDKANLAADSSLTALFISEYLEIPFQKLPILIFTEDLSLTHLYWTSTSSLSLISQLKFLESAHPQFEPSWLKQIHNFKKVKKKELNSSFNHVIENLKLKIIKLYRENLSLNNHNDENPTLYKKQSYYNKFHESESDYSLSFDDTESKSDKQENITPGKNNLNKDISKDFDISFNKDIRMTVHHSKQLNQNLSPDERKNIIKKGNIPEKELELSLFYSGIKFLKRKTDKYNESIYKKNNEVKEEKSDYFTKLENFNKTSKIRTFDKNIVENLVFLEKDSRLFLEQGLKMLKIIQTNDLYDFSPFILPFAKSFEKELSYSIVHWVRQKYDITLPLFFYEYEPDKNAQVKIGRNYSINFNQSRNDLWASPTLGGQISGFKNTVLDSKDHPFKSDEDYQQFLNLAYQIKNIRNRACHSEKTTLWDLEKMINCWEGLFKINSFETLGTIKKEYMGQQ